jgi:hypothetical protein
VELRLQECTYPEIAEQLGCSKRTVRRIVKCVQSRWQSLLEESSLLGGTSQEHRASDTGAVRSARGLGRRTPLRPQAGR